MAVAAHVGKVSKDYSPYGFSIMEDARARFGALAHSSSHDVCVHVPLDADVYVESATLVFDGAAAANADWNVTLYNHSTSVALTSASVATGSVAALTPQALVVNQNQVVKKDAVLIAKFTDDGSAGNSPSGVVIVRYRRKA